MTIAEQRKKELLRFSDRYNIELNTAKRLVNSFYKFCGLEETLLYRENNEKTCNSSYTKELQAKEEAWINRLQKELSVYGLEMKWFGYLPTICEKANTSTALYRYFYN